MLDPAKKIEEIYAQIKNKFPIIISVSNNQIVKIIYEDTWIEDNITKHLTTAQIKKINSWIDEQLK